MMMIMMMLMMVTMVLIMTVMMMVVLLRIMMMMMVMMRITMVIMIMMMIMVMIIITIVMIRHHIFAGTGLHSVGSKLPGTFHRLLDPAVQNAQPLARTKGRTDSLCQWSEY